MHRFTSKKLLAAGAAIALVGGAGGAIAASQGGGASGDGFIARVAQHLGISTQKLEDATKAAAIDQVDADLKAGRITKAQADELKARIRAGEFPFFAGPRGFGFRHHHGLGDFHHGDRLSAAADYLGLTQAQLLQRLAGGESLAEVAKAQDKSVDGLKQAMLAGAKKHLDQAVKDGRLTEAQAKEELNELESRIDDIVNGALRRGPGMHRGFGWRGAPPDDAGPWLAPAA